MKRLVFTAAAVLALVLFASGMFFEWVLVDLLQDSDPSTRLDDAFFLSLVFDLVIVSLAAAALTWPFYRRIRRLQRVAQRQRAGDADARARFEGSDVLAELAHTFDALADANAQHLENQRALLRAVSHELRTPVARLRFAMAEIVSADQRRRGELRERAEQDIEELDALVDEVLAYVRVGPGGAPRETEPFDLADVLSQVVAEHPTATIELDAPTHIALEGEPHLVRRAVSNLVRNAVAHAKTRVTVAATVEGDVRISVLDDGPGLPEDADERLFLPFVRYDDRPGGTGLGSSIAMAIAQRHGGSLHFTPRPPGTGAEFVLRLPLRAGTPPRESAAETP